ncbi:Oxalate decarboxylase [Venturia nashicola]|uniref:non-specific serine/threonine protein kinase n=1 Tax=Venturia nashicola TaxID=86259 RepID=A0A4Z1P8K8_9PEZI|nr:Oxalate decarboxylase [Venturia nashicola]
MSSTEPEDKTVRFSSIKQEFSPEQSLSPQPVGTLPGREPRDDIPAEAQEELRNLSMSLEKSRLQSKRMGDFAFEPVSLPVSRVPSNSSSQPQSGRPTPKHSPPVSSMHTPPLTPAASGSGAVRPASAHDKLLDPASAMTPQTSPPHEAPPTSLYLQTEARPSAAAQARLPRSSNSRPRSMVEGTTGAISSLPKQAPYQGIGSTGDSLPPSSDGSPIGTPRPGTPGTISGTQSPYSRPFTPAGDPNDPYARAKRAPQGRNVDAVENRFIFGGRNDRPKSAFVSSSNNSSTQLPMSNGGGGTKADNKRHTGFFGSKQDGKDGHHGGSMSDLKRFFKLGGHKKDKSRDKSRDKSPGRSSIMSMSKTGSGSGTRTPPSNRNSIAIPFADDHGIESRYGKFGKVLGSGAGGSVRLMRRQSDGVTFAVKQFRDRHSYESEREYNKKVTAEFCIGSTLHHGNIIETMDIVQEKGKWYEVMEYAPYDLFAIVMTGKMSKEEVTCSTLQILSGVTYLHSMGLAHRDLKLDNVVVNEHGIMKIIDFGSAVVFRYPFESQVVLASGIVGSDPYLAPEVYDMSKYDPQPTDIWSMAIIFCCMTLRRFPWKAPRLSDNSYKLFVTEPTDDEKRSGPYPQKPAPEPASRTPSDPNDSHRHSRKSTDETNSSRSASDKPQQSAASQVESLAQSQISTATGTSQQQQVIKGPWRLLRLLPRETRHIVSRMLDLDPKTRATLEEVLQDPWVLNARVCAQEDSTGRILRAEGHVHTLEPGAGGSAPTVTKK